MICKVISTVESYELFKGVATVAVGVSGGADSVCLLHILTCLKDRYCIIPKAVHINHNLRGEEALRDEIFVRELCKKLGVELTVFSVDVKTKAKELGVGEEECGRLVRYECFAKLGCDAVAVAHSLSDSIETAFFNFARGTALKGLCGIPPKREPNIIRPLIECSRSEIEEYCRTNGLEYMTDSTNLSCDYMRNHIRHRLIPDVSHINSGYEKSIGRCMLSLSEDCEYLDLQAKDLYNRACLEEGYSLSELRSAHRALRKRVLARILKEYMTKDVDNRHILLFENAVMGECDKVEIGADMYIRVKDDIVTVGPVAKYAEEWQSEFINGRAVTPYGTYSLQYTDTPCEAAIDAGKIKGKLYLSSRKSGDSFTFEKRKITKSLKKLFNEIKIPSEKRNSIAVLHDGNEVVWVEGIGVNVQYIPGDQTEEFLIIKKEG